MNRLIKFRASYQDKLYPVTQIDWAYQFGPQVYMLTDSGNPIAMHLDHTELMQFTGLLDKNGKEIYEGDILRLDSWSTNQQIKFIEGAFCLADSDGDYSGDIHYIHHAEIPQATVIGNIYENPDLLKANK